MKDTNLSKSHADKFRLIIFLSYFAVIAVTIVLSLWNAGFDPSKINWVKVLGEVLISSALTIIAMFMALADGRLYFHNTDKHPFKLVFETHQSTAWGLIRRGLSFAFSGYAHLEYLARYDEYLLSLIRTVGLQDIRILQLSREELRQLCNEPLLKLFDGKEVGFDIITDIQYVHLLKIKDGRYEYEETPADWFLSGVSSQSSDLYRYYARSSKLRARNRRLRIAYRLIMLLVIAIIWAGIFVGDDPFGSQSIINAVLRTCTVVFAIVSGYLASKDETDNETDELSYKKLFLDKFFSDYKSGVYVPADLTDIVKEKLKKLDAEITDDEFYNPISEELVDTQ